MLVAISQRNTRSPEYGSVDSLELSYVEYFNKFDATLIPVPNIGRVVKKYLHELKIEGIILSGGGDVHPTLYGANPTSLENVPLDRDETEKALLEIATEQDLPVLGICRGMQSINVQFGGRLIRNIRSDVKGALDHVGTEHKITIVEDSVVSLLGTNTSTVNSYHNLGISKEQLSQDFVPFAIAEDQIIEGMYNPKYAIATIMWHPERSTLPTALDAILTRSFVSREMFWRERK